MGSRDRSMDERSFQKREDFTREISFNQILYQKKVLPIDSVKEMLKFQTDKRIQYEP